MISFTQFLKAGEVLMNVKKFASIVLISLMIISCISCVSKPPVQSGFLDESVQFDDLNIKGEVTFTISNESGTKAESVAPKALAKAFMQAYPNTTVKIDDSSRTSYENRIVGGTIGDVFWCDSDDAARYKTQHSALMALDYYIRPLGINLNDVFIGSRGAGMIDGMFYMVPRELSQQALVYNKDALEEAGVSIPEDRAMTWDEFKQICIQVTEESDTGAAYTQVGAQMYVGWQRSWIAFAEGWGGVWCHSEDKYITFTSSPEVMYGLNELVDACLTGWMKPSDVPLSGDLGSKYNGLSSKDYVFQQMGHIQWLTRIRTEYERAATNWDFTYYPQFPTHVVCSEATGYVVYNRTTNKDTAAALALFFLTEAGQEAYHSQTGGGVPALQTLSEAAFWRYPNDEDLCDKNWDVFVAYPECTIQGNTVVRMPIDISNLFSHQNMINIFQQIFAGARSLEDAFGNLETKANELWETLY